MTDSSIMANIAMLMAKPNNEKYLLAVVNNTMSESPIDAYENRMGYYMSIRSSFLQRHFGANVCITNSQQIYDLCKNRGRNVKHVKVGFEMYPYTLNAE
jgi:hypothetical protein